MKKILAVLLSVAIFISVLPLSIIASAEDATNLADETGDNLVIFSASDDEDGKIYYSGSKKIGENGLGYTTPGILKNDNGIDFNSSDGSAYLFSHEIDGENMWKIDFNANEDGTHVIAKGGRTQIYPLYSQVYDSTGTAIAAADVETLGDNVENIDEYTNLAIRLRLVDDGTGRAVEGATHSISLNLFAADAKHDNNWNGWKKSGAVYFYDINTGEKTYVTTNTVDLPLGFNGYIIYPKNGANFLSGALANLADVVSFHIFPHWGCSHSGLKATDNWVGTELYIGDMILTKNINSFNSVYGLPEFNVTANGTSINVTSNDVNALYSFDQNEWLTLAEFNESATNLNGDTEYIVYSKSAYNGKIVSKKVKTTPTNNVMFAVTDDADDKLFYAGSKKIGENGLGYTTPGILKQADGVNYATSDGSSYLFADEIDGEKMWKIDFNANEDGTHVRTTGGRTEIYPFYSQVYDSAGTAIAAEDVETLGDNFSDANEYTHLAIRLKLVDDGTGRAVEGATHSISLNLFAAGAKHDNNWNGWKNKSVYFYDVNTGEKTYVTANTVDLPLGFDGYVVYPNNSVILDTSGSVTSFADLVKFHIFPHWGCSHSGRKATDNWVGTELYIGDMILTKNINSFNLAYGVPSFDVTASDTIVTVISNDTNTLYSFDKNAEEWLPLAEFSAKANNLNRNTEYTVYAKYPESTKILSKTVKTTNTGIMWNLLDVPEEENFYNYKNKYINWHVNLSMWRDKDPFAQDSALYRVGDDSGVYTRESDGEYFVILNPNEVLNDSGKIKEANGGVYFNTLSGRGLTDDGDAKTGVPEGIDASKTEYLAVRFKITGGEADQYSSVGFQLNSAFISMKNAYLIDKTTGAISNSILSGALLGINGEFDGWVMVPWENLYYSQRQYIQSTGDILQMYFHTATCSSSHGADTSSDWQNKIFYLGDVSLVDDEELFLETYAKLIKDSEGMVFSADDMHAINGAYEQMPNTFEATLKFPEGYNNFFRGGVITGNVGYEGENVNFEIFSSGNPRIYAQSNDVVYNMLFDEVNVFTGEWVHIAIVNDQTSQTMTCYVNGVAAQTIEGCIPEIISEQAGVLGGDIRSGNRNYFCGELRSVALYREARGAEEIAVDATTFANGSPLAAWDLTKEATNGTITDESGNGYDIKLGSVWYTDDLSSDDYDYTFALIGDTQKVNRFHADEFPDIYDWLIENKEEKKIEYVMGLGDITDVDADREWADAATQHAKLDGVIPYSLIRGNHDGSEKFNATFNKAPYNTSYAGQFDERIENTWREFSICGVDYLIFALDLGPTDAELAWASEIIKAHPDHNVIITTHAYLDSNAKPLLPSSGYRAIHMWDSFVSQHSNIVLIVAGHISSSVIPTTQRAGVNGNIVTEMLVNPQGVDDYIGATGMVTLLHFSEGGSKVTVETVSTVKDKHYMPYNQFELEIPVVKHTHSYELEGAIAKTEPTCTEGGYTTYTCDTCGEISTADETEALGHDYVAGEVVAPQVGVQGYTVYTCSVCGATENRDFVDALPEEEEPEVPSDIVTNVTLTTTDVDMTLTWDAFPGATLYWIKYYVKGQYDTTAQTVTTTDLSFSLTYKTLKYNTEYAFKVMAQVGNKYPNATDLNKATEVSGSFVLDKRAVNHKVTYEGKAAILNFDIPENASTNAKYAIVFNKDTGARVTTVTVPNGSTTARLVNELVPGIPYYAVVSLYVDGKYMPTDECIQVDFTIPLTEIVEYKKDAETPTSVRISWASATSKIYYYWVAIYEKETNTRLTTKQTKQTYTAFTGLKPNTEYEITIQASVQYTLKDGRVETKYYTGPNGDGVLPRVSYTTPDYTYVKPTVVAEGNNVTISWDAAEVASSYYIYEQTATGRKLVKGVANTETSYTLTAAAGEHTYGVAVCIKNLAGTSYAPVTWAEDAVVVE